MYYYLTNNYYIYKFIYIQIIKVVQYFSQDPFFYPTTPTPQSQPPTPPTTPYTPSIPPTPYTPSTPPPKDPIEITTCPGLHPPKLDFFNIH